MKIVLFSIVLVLAGCAAKQPVSSLKTDIVHSDTMEIIRSAAESADSLSLRYPCYFRNQSGR